MQPVAFQARIHQALVAIESQGLSKPERVLTSAQGAMVTVRLDGDQSLEAINMCANNYLGLADDPRVIEAVVAASRRGGAGMASVRFICGTHTLHKELERATADYLGYEDVILFAAAFDANAAVFESLLDDVDVIVSDSLNHASIIDGIRLCKAQRLRYTAGDMAGLESQLKAARALGARTIVVATDGVFSMDGVIADLQQITALCERYEALLMVDDCHATGILGDQGKGTATFRGVDGKVDLLTGTYGKALGGAMGGFIAGRANVINLLRQKARPYLFSNALPPGLCGGAMEAIRISASEEGADRRARLFANARRFRAGMDQAGFTLAPGEHPIIPVMVGDARQAQDLAAALLQLGVLVTGFSYPVVPRGMARIRTQVSAVHTAEQIDQVVAAFVAARASAERPQVGGI